MAAEREKAPRGSARSTAISGAEGQHHGDANDGPLTLVPRAPSAGPVIEITPSPDEYDQLVRDLARLRERGAPSNTAAVVAAVHAAARDRMRRRDHENAGRR